MEKQSQAVIYARYSSHAQKDVSIDQQVKKITEYAKKHGIKIIKTYEDRAISGTTDRRPNFQKMIAEAAKLEYDYVIVYALDRFARDRYDSAVYKRELKQHGKRVLSVTENISDDPSGVLMESLLEGLAEYYSKELSQKIRRGLTDNAEKCIANGLVPLGYRRGEDGKYEIVEPEAEIVREIFQRVAGGDTFAAIADDLNERKIRTKTGAEWNRSSFNSIIVNEKYIGTYTYGSIRVEDGIPAILDKELFYKVQKALDNKKNPRHAKGRRNENGVYMLTGKLFCGECRSPMVGVSGTGKNGKLHFYYACKKQKKHLCHKAAVSRDAVEYAVTKAIKDNILSDDDNIAAMADLAIEQAKEIRKSSEAERLKTELADVQISIKNLVAAIEKGIISSHTQSRLAELEKQEEELIRDVSLCERPSEAVSREEVIALLNMFRDGEIADKVYQEALINAFVVAVYLYDDKRLRIKFNLGENEADTDIPAEEEIEQMLDGVRCSYNVENSPPKKHYTNTNAFILDVYKAFLLCCMVE